MQNCMIISLDNNNSVKFTSSREDNSTTNDSMVMKIAHAQLHMYTNIMYKFQSSACKTVEEKLQTKLCLWTDWRTDRQKNRQPWRFQYTPSSTSLWGGIKMAEQYLSWQLTNYSYLVFQNSFVVSADFKLWGPVIFHLLIKTIKP